MKKIFLFSIAILITSYSLHSQCTDCYQTVNTGQYSSAIGKLTKSMGLTSFASGFGSEAQGFYTTSMGFYSFAIGSKDIAIGSAVRASGGKSIVIGAGEWNAKVFLNNPIPRSLMIGFSSQYPTLFVSDSPLSAFFDRTGRVGIGNITNPQAKLHLLADEKEEAAILIEPFDWDSREPATLFLGNKQNSIVTAKGKGMFFISEGNYTFTNASIVNIAGQIQLSGGSPGAGKVLVCDDTGLASWQNASGGADDDWLIEGDNIIRNQGSVIIGNGLNIPEGYKLYVSEGILTEQVKVAIKNTNDWSDYVFEKDYSPISLNELEIYITKHKRLPEMPSAESVVQNGINLGEMDAALLKKIEELTLYVIEQNKKMEALEKEQKMLYEIIITNLYK